jgi:5'-nucleotidase
VSYILVTNDDGVDSPALLPLIRELRALGPIRVAVPASERSWIGKAISRWDEIEVRTLVRDGIEIVAVDGYPADCTNLAVHSLFGEPPDLVVSGVNIGLNIGLPLERNDRRGDGGLDRRHSGDRALRRSRRPGSRVEA